MGKRGRCKIGYNLALLYALDFHYQVEFRKKGNHPSLWEPLPRRRPDQFLCWITDCLTVLEDATPTTFDALLVILRQKRLDHIAKVLKYVTNHEAFTPCALISHGFPEASSNASDRHPQVRKYAKVIRRVLDHVWKEALVRAQHRYPEHWPKSAFLLGGLPLGFDTVSKHLFDNLAAFKEFGGYRELTAFQFYGVASGKLPKFTGSWGAVLEQLAELSSDEIQLLKILTERQVNQIRALDEQTMALLKWGLQNYGHVRWQAITHAFGSLSGTEFKRIKSFLSGLGPMSVKECRKHLTKNLHSPGAEHISMKFIVAHTAPKTRKLLPILQLTSLDTWKMISGLDEEVCRIVINKQLDGCLRQRLQMWDFKLVREIQELLRTNLAWVEIYLEDRKTVQGLLATRTAAKLDLHELFPLSIAFLDRYVQDHLEEVLIEYVSDVEATASKVWHERLFHLPPTLLS